MTRSPTRAHRLALAAERGWDRLIRRRTEPGRLSVITFMGHGTTERVVARGRVVANVLPAPATGVEPLWRRVRRSASAFVTDEVAGVVVAVSLGGAVAEGVSDEEGYFEVAIDGLDLDPRRLFHPLAISLGPDHRSIPVQVTPAEVMVPTPRARRLVISDIDDTVLKTGAQRRMEMILTTLTGSAWTRVPFPGVARLYSGLGRGPGHDEDNPFFYVSSSPWNLYLFLQAFIERSVLPAGPLFLRDLGIDEGKFIKGSHDQHKREAVEEILATHDLPAVLIGDTGQRDPEIYRSVADDHPGRVQAVLLRHVADSARENEVRAMYGSRGVPWAMGLDSLGLSEAAEDLGLIPPAWRSRVRV